MKKISSFLIISLTYLLSFTSDRIFTYSYQSNVLEKGQMDLETSNTLRFKKLDFYRAIDSRLEFEVGVGKNTQTAFYFNFSQDAKAVLNGADVTIEKSFDISFSNEWLHQFKNPVSDKIGVAAYGEFKIGLQEIELESKLILDKQINKFTTVGNIILEYEITKDFKIPEEIPLERFLETEQQRHSEQLLKYANAMRMLDDRKIRAGLYFPSIPAWREIPVDI